MPPQKRRASPEEDPQSTSSGNADKSTRHGARKRTQSGDQFNIGSPSSNMSTISTPVYSTAASAQSFGESRPASRSSQYYSNIGSVPASPYFTGASAQSFGGQRQASGSSDYYSYAPRSAAPSGSTMSSAAPTQRRFSYSAGRLVPPSPAFTQNAYDQDLLRAIDPFTPSQQIPTTGYAPETEPFQTPAFGSTNYLDDTAFLPPLAAAQSAYVPDLVRMTESLSLSQPTATAGYTQEPRSFQPPARVPAYGPTPTPKQACTPCRQSCVGAYCDGKQPCNMCTEGNINQCTYAVPSAGAPRRSHIAQYNVTETPGTETSAVCVPCMRSNAASKCNRRYPCSECKRLKNQEYCAPATSTRGESSAAAPRHSHTGQHTGQSDRGRAGRPYLPGTLLNHCDECYVGARECSDGPDGPNGKCAYCHTNKILCTFHIMSRQGVLDPVYDSIPEKVSEKCDNCAMTGVKCGGRALYRPPCDNCVLAKVPCTHVRTVTKRRKNKGST